MPSSPLLRLASFAALGFLSACATAPDRRDPLEPFNREMFQFNQDFDEKIAKPVAEVYRNTVPAQVRKGVRNFFANLGDVIVFVNDTLQMKWHDAVNDAGRVMVNTTLGLGGLMDVASELGVEKRNEDFGQTLGYWGLPAGPYLVLPILGPSTFPRDTAGIVGDFYAWPVSYVEDDAVAGGLGVLRFIQVRADLLGTEDLLEQAALDRYVFVRDAYLQRRESLIRDGRPPKLEEEE